MVRAAHERVQFMNGALAMVYKLADNSDAKKHRDLRRAEIESIATLVELLFNKSVVPGWDISKFAKNTEKNVRYRA
jgi:hypothetical protein